MRGPDSNGRYPDVDAIGHDTRILTAAGAEIAEAIRENTRQRVELTESLTRLGDKMGAYLDSLTKVIADLEDRGQ